MTQGAPRREAELARLCRACALCCDGSLFGLAGLRKDEVEPARRRGLRVLPNGNGFEQPCAALSSSGSGGRQCSIYDERPASCRSFSCRLYERHSRDGGDIEDRLAVVERVRALVAYLEASGFTPGDFDGPSPVEQAGRDERASDAHRELLRTLEEDFARAR